MEERDDRFRGWVERQALEAINSGINTYPTLLAELGSVYPAVLLAALERLACRGEIPASIAEAALAAARCRLDLLAPPTQSLPLPVPHPLDFDWRFSAAAVQFLMEEVRQWGGPLVCLGAPSLFRSVARQSDGFEAYLIDANPAVVTQLASPLRPASTILADLAVDRLPDLEAGSIVADPPWYPEYIHLFLSVARSLCSDKSRIWISVPPVGTRPGIEAEREELLRSGGESLGLMLTGDYPGALIYTTPPFERNALRAEGILGVPETWRRGDLLVFSPTGTHWSQVTPPKLGSEAVWSEVDWMGVRVRFRMPGGGVVPQVRDPCLRSVVAGDILSSVSRRDPVREEVQVWTSGNRVFRCDDVELLHAIAQACAENKDIRGTVHTVLARQPSSDEIALALQAESQFRNLITTEWEEYAEKWRG
jgi:hypothetical protein